MNKKRNKMNVKKSVSVIVLVVIGAILFIALWLRNGPAYAGSVEALVAAAANIIRNNTETPLEDDIKGDELTHPDVEGRLNCTPSSPCFEKLITTPSKSADDRTTAAVLTTLGQAGTALGDQSSDPLSKSIMAGYTGLTTATGSFFNVFDYAKQEEFIDDAVAKNEGLAGTNTTRADALRREAQASGRPEIAELKNVKADRLDHIASAQTRAAAEYDLKSGEMNRQKWRSIIETGMSLATAAANIGVANFMRDKGEDKPDYSALLNALRNRDNSGDYLDDAGAPSGPLLTDAEDPSVSQVVENGDDKLKDLLSNLGDSGFGGGGGNFFDEPGGLNTMADGNLPDSTTAKDLKGSEGSKFLGKASGDPGYGGGGGGGIGSDSGMPDFESLFSKFLPSGDGKEGFRQNRRLAGIGEEEKSGDILGSEKGSLFATVHHYYEGRQKELIQLQAALKNPLLQKEENRDLAAKLSDTSVDEKNKGVKQ